MIYTIGYAGTEIERFVEILKEKKIKFLIDVRSVPYSHQFWRFDELNIFHALEKHGIFYQNWKNEFGARQENRNFYSAGVLDFEKFAMSEEFRHGISKLKGLKDENVCLMCAEIDPINCHRAILCARNLADCGFEIVHIIAKRNGKTTFEKHKDFEQRLIKTTKAETLDDAYRIQNKKIGYNIQYIKVEKSKKNEKNMFFEQEQEKNEK